MQTKSILVLGLMATSAACTKPVTATSTVKHNENQLTNSANAWNWVNDSEDDYFNYVAPIVGSPTSRNAYLPAGSELRVRMDAWLSRFHEALLAAHPEQVGNAPKPEAQILITEPDNVNAFVSPVIACYSNVSVDFGGPAPAPAANLLLYNGAFEAGDSYSSTCIKRTASRAEIEDRIAREFIGNDCQVDIREPSAETFVVVPSSGCDVPSIFEGTGIAKTLLVFQTSHWVTIHTALVKEMTEQQVVAVLAHELGHYYRSHINMARRYNFAYHLDFDREATEPQPINGNSTDPVDQQIAAASNVLASLLATESRLGADLSSRENMQRIDAFAPIAGQKLHTAMYPLTLEAILAFADPFSDDCNAAENDGMSFSSEALQTPPGADLRVRLLAFEAKAETCLKTIAFSEVQRLRLQDRQPIYPAWVYLSTDVTTTNVWDWLKSSSDVLKIAAPSYNLAAVQVLRDNLSKFNALYAEYDNIYDREAVIGEYLNEHLIGLYSYEQEADEIGLEFLTLIGVSPVESSNVDLYFAEAFGNQFGDHCRTLHEADWRENGLPVVIPIGNIEYHHDSCFRVFNSDREIASHGYLNGRTFDATFSAPAAWAELQASLPTSWSDSDSPDQWPVSDDSGPMSRIKKLRPDFQCKLGGFTLKR